VAFSFPNFMAHFNQKGLLRNNRYEVALLFPPPAMVNSKVLSDYRTVHRDLTFYVDQADLPGISIFTHEVSRFGYGPMEKKPYVPGFTDVRLAFRSDAGGLVLKFLHEWARCVIDYSNPETDMSSPGMNPRHTPYEVSYKADYAVDVAVRLFDERSRVISEVVLREAFPSMVGDVPLAWQAQRDYAQVPVSLSYYDWHHVKTKP
jgi:hypothetical protein